MKVYNIVNQAIDFGYRPQFITDEAHNTKGRKSKILPGDVLMNIVGPPLGKVAIIPKTFDEWNCNQALTIFRPSEAVITEWLYHFLRSGIPVSTVIGETRGVVGQVNISLSQCRNFAIPIPPIREQRRIVTKLDQLSERSSAARDHLTRVTALATRAKQAISSAAFRGALLGLEPVDTEKFNRRCWDLPKGWHWARFDEVAKIKSNLKPPSEMPDLPHVAPDNIESGTGRLLPYNTIAEDGVKSGKHKFFFWPDHLLKNSTISSEGGHRRF
ncbi:restriction endonuclease subunit S [Aliiroseovarius crassostreae]|uniref:restriction endonuclease subunit S n=1 Tax=Aliiroseovarius crassostreae TaxID=154981 RepID=UPI0020C8D30D|nr:restriction endonuclease subunit S [Aliiroseovarius crassostreae]